MTRWSIAMVALLLGATVGSFLSHSFLQGQNTVPVAAAIPKEITSYRDVVKRVLPAVVSIEGQAKARPKAKADSSQPRRRFRADDQQMPEEFRKFFEEMEKRQAEVPDEVPAMGFGSGFLVDPKGVILTNFHVVNGADSVRVQLKDGRKYTSHDIHGDRKTDLAIVRIHSETPLPFLELGDSDAMEIGDRVLAVGAPFGLTGSVTAGIISAKGRNGLNVNMYEDFLQTDAAINPGNSGGPLVNLEGKVIGINSAIKSRSGGFQGVGLAIASNLAKNIMTSLLHDGLVHRGYLGVQMSDLQPEVAARLDLKDQAGVVVGRVFEGAPADKAGVQPGDIITSMGGKPVKNGHELQQLVATLPLRKPVDLTVLRDGKSKVLQVTIEEQPDNFGTVSLPRQPQAPKDEEAVALDKVGIEVKELTAEQAEQLGYKDNVKGVLISKVEQGSIASENGLAAGMLISKVDDHAVNNPAAVRKYLEKCSLDKGVLLQVQSPQGGTRYVILKAEAASK
jgi:serine protease Do